VKIIKLCVSHERFNVTAGESVSILEFETPRKRRKRVRNLCPSIIDYAVNIGLEPVDGQWSTLLKENRSLRSHMNLATMFQEIAEDFDMHSY